MIDSITNKYENNSFSTDPASAGEIDEVNHVWFPRQSGTSYPTFKNKLYTDEKPYRFVCVSNNADRLFRSKEG
jgi:hypothetical protein